MSESFGQRNPIVDAMEGIHGVFFGNCQESIALVAYWSGFRNHLIDQGSAGIHVHVS